MVKKKATRSSKKTKSSGTVNKTTLIKEALASSPDASPKEIAAIVGHGISAQYVSTVKSNIRAAGKKAAKKKLGRPKGTKKAARKRATSGEGLDAAISFIESAGSVEAAKQQIEKIEQIKRR